MANTSRIVIIGSGPAGLGAGWRLTELGHDNFVLYEKNNYVGGLAASFTDEKGFTWDVGGHVLHSHYPYFDAMFESVMKGQYYTHKRESWVWIAGRFVPYPFQNNIHLLPEEMRRECDDGLQHRSDKSSNNFADWIVNTYGKGIARHFLLPYNKKVWAYPLEKMSTQWVSDRIAPSHLRGSTWGPNAVFHYPKYGGTGDIWKRVAARFFGKIRLQKEMVSLDRKNKRVYFSDGSADSYDYLFSTMPLDILVPRIQKSLHRSHVTIVGVGMAGRPPVHLQTKCWMYFPGDEPYFRATVLSNYSKYNAPKGCWSLMFEISSSRYRRLTKDVVKQTLNSSLIPVGSTIVDVWSMTSEYGYPTPTQDRDHHVDPALKDLENDGIYSRGRFGMWKYEVSNQDHTFMQGVEWADAMMRHE